MDELVKRVRQVAEEVCDDYDVDPYIAEQRFFVIEEAADAIEELQQISAHYEESAHDYFKDVCYYLERVPKWIPVTERLPEEHVFVLIRQDEDRMMVAERVDGDWWYRYFSYDVDRWDENEQGTITHWMPLPTPPKEE